MLQEQEHQAYGFSKSFKTPHGKIRNFRRLAFQKVFKGFKSSTATEAEQTSKVSQVSQVFREERELLKP
jgi:hypothetical protein